MFSDRRRLLPEHFRIFRVAVEPIAAAMRLQIGLALKSARLNGLRWRQQCLG